MASDAGQLVWAISGAVVTIILAAVLAYWTIQESRRARRSRDAAVPPAPDAESPAERPEDPSHPIS